MGAAVLGICVTAPARARPSLVTLLDLSSVAGTPQLGGCASGLSSLREALDAIGIPTQRPTITSVDNLRVSLMQMTAQSGGDHLVIACGYGAVQNQNLFLAPPAAHGGAVDLTRDAVSAATLAHSVGQGGATLLDLNALPGGASPAAALSAWQAGAEPGTTRLGALNATSEGAALVQRVTAAAQGHGDATMAELLGVPPGPVTAPPPSAAASVVVPPAAGTPHPAAVTPPPPAASKPAPSTQAPAAPVPAPASAPPARPDPQSVAPSSDVAASHAVAGPAGHGTPVAAKLAAKQKPKPRKPPVRADKFLRDVQRGLLADGDYHGVVSGFANPATTAGIKKFQTKHNLPATGTLTPDQLKILEGG